MRWLALALTLVLFGCDKPKPEGGGNVGRWAVVPAGNNESVAGYSAWNAWRIDTQTGALEHCTYSLTANPRDPNAQTLAVTNCSDPDKPYLAK
jgi:hypothetical protein